MFAFKPTSLVQTTKRFCLSTKNLYTSEVPPASTFSSVGQLSDQQFGFPSDLFKQSKLTHLRAPKNQAFLESFICPNGWLSFHKISIESFRFLRFRFFHWQRKWEFSDFLGNQETLLPAPALCACSSPWPAWRFGFPPGNTPPKLHGFTGNSLRKLEPLLGPWGWEKSNL